MNNMKHINKFNKISEELHSNTYKSASDKLRKIGLYDRANNIDLYRFKKDSYDGYLLKNTSSKRYELFNIKEIYYSFNHIKNGSVEYAFNNIKNKIFTLSGIVRFVSDNIIKEDFTINITIHTSDNTSGGVSVSKLSSEVQFERKSAVKFKKEIIPKILSCIPISELFMILNINSNIYKNVINSIENISINNLCSDDRIILYEGYMPKLINELKSDTYKSASKKFRYMGLHDKADNLDRWRLNKNTNSYLVKSNINSNYESYYEKEIYYIINNKRNLDIDSISHFDNDSFSITLIGVIELRDSHYRIKSVHISINIFKKGKYESISVKNLNSILLDKESAIKFRKELIPKMLDCMPLGDLFILSNISSNIYKKVTNNIRNINLNILTGNNVENSTIFYWNSNPKINEELNLDTYKSAANKLYSSGNIERASKIRQYINKDYYIITKMNDVFEFKNIKFEINNKEFNIDTIESGIEENLRKISLYRFNMLLAIKFNFTNLNKNLTRDLQIVLEIIKDNNKIEVLLTLYGISFTRNSAVKFKKDLLPIMLDSIPFSEMFMLLGINSKFYKDIMNSITNININSLTSTNIINTLFKDSTYINKKPILTNEELSPELIRRTYKELDRLGHSDRARNVRNHYNTFIPDENYYRTSDGEYRKFSDINWFISTNNQTIKCNDFNFDSFLEKLSGDEINIHIVLKTSKELNEWKSYFCEFDINFNFSNNFVKIEYERQNTFYDRANVIKFKKNILPIIFDKIPLTEIFMSLNLNSTLYKEIMNSILNMRNNLLYGSNLLKDEIIFESPIDDSKIYKKIKTGGRRKDILSKLKS